MGVQKFCPSCLVDSNQKMNEIRETFLRRLPPKHKWGLVRYVHASRRINDQDDGARNTTVFTSGVCFFFRMIIR